jgi:hypothetical protein
MGLMTIGSVYNSVNANDEGINPDFEVSKNNDL